MCQTKNKLPLESLLLPALLLLWAPTSFAERADHDMPINLEADQVLVDDAKQVSTFTGKVRLSQGSLLIRGDKIVVKQDKSGFMHATAYGKTAEFRQKREGLDGYVEGYGERIEYDTRTETFNFHVQARLKRGQDEVLGEHITYNAKTEIFRVSGGSASSADAPPQRVRAVLQPKSKEGTASTPAPDTPPLTPGENPAPTE
ncbi:MAG: lipopolysaccharide transport periplasmic protein LptA [Gallionellales bacterium RBG_16_56_9]|nr:MAG: lipopolysaccharide transport periplasmic protein LptA [Gallionellales bacterium RIFCSPLOWO2_02_FULL_57_47]OGS95491.1 MAG: lipopolysaccharide transport periplasmic protein LptA [Gallionellales bacterium RIFCSPLOWO2_12_FULL_57_18]OGS96615.1 MAG: lipopolysaccharide transport periplasmic protein LptA [Gallionellales bacterium RBG_16_56_9]OGT16752.1 MAG: lipopolysaccharide transport periplasmic protein LptA [Gallionellales bacterium RIFCSPHIGHO2_02_FULL_57_16]